MMTDEERLQQFLTRRGYTCHIKEGGVEITAPGWADGFMIDATLLFHDEQTQEDGLSLMLTGTVAFKHVRCQCGTLLLRRLEVQERSPARYVGGPVYRSLAEGPESEPVTRCPGCDVVIGLQTIQDVDQEDK